MWPNNKGAIFKINHQKISGIVVHSTPKESTYLLCFLTSMNSKSGSGKTQHRVWGTVHWSILLDLHFEYSSENKVYTFFWSWVYDWTSIILYINKTSLSVHSFWTGHSHCVRLLSVTTTCHLFHTSHWVGPQKLTPFFGLSLFGKSRQKAAMSILGGDAKMTSWAPMT